MPENLTADRGQIRGQDLSQDLAKDAPKNHVLKEGLPPDKQDKICVLYGQLTTKEMSMLSFLPKIASQVIPLSKGRMNTGEEKGPEVH